MRKKKRKDEIRSEKDGGKIKRTRIEWKEVTKWYH